LALQEGIDLLAQGIAVCGHAEVAGDGQADRQGHLAGAGGAAQLQKKSPEAVMPMMVRMQVVRAVATRSVGEKRSP
jgi:hypothetical protein